MLAKRYTDNHWDGKLPVGVEQIVRARGIEVVVPKEETTSYLQYRDGKAKIVVFAKDQNQLNYKLAFFLCLYDRTHGEVNATYEEKESCYSSTNDYTWSACNNFAVDLLMPERLLNIAIVDRGLTTISKLASAFGVSEVAMRKRLQQIRVM